MQYDLHISTADPRKLVFVENWTTAEALDQHLKSEHMKAFQNATADLRSAPTVFTYSRIA